MAAFSRGSVRGTMYPHLPRTSQTTDLRSRRCSRAWRLGYTPWSRGSCRILLLFAFAFWPRIGGVFMWCCVVTGVVFRSMPIGQQRRRRSRLASFTSARCRRACVRACFLICGARSPALHTCVRARACAGHVVFVSLSWVLSAPGHPSNKSVEFSGRKMKHAFGFECGELGRKAKITSHRTFFGSRPIP